MMPSLFARGGESLARLSPAAAEPSPRNASDTIKGMPKRGQTAADEEYYPGKEDSQVGRAFSSRAIRLAWQEILIYSSGMKVGRSFLSDGA